VPISNKIQQLIISPYGDYLAILTNHTIHVAVLPDPAHLASDDSTPLKLKTYHIGPITHVVERSALACALWHPLGINGACLVTVTKDAVVRLWELNRDNKGSFDSPALAVDLKKLANGVSASEDFSPSKYGVTPGFSPDSFEMEVASACFGGCGDGTETAWAPMTLWIAMHEGDVYALCPLLPSTWTTRPTLMHRLAAAVSCDTATLETANDNGNAQSLKVNPQASWFLDLNTQVQASVNSDSARHEEIIVRRPQRPGPIPKLQGPFNIMPDNDSVVEITDILAISGSRQELHNFNNYADEYVDSSNTNMTFICLATTEGTVQVCLDVHGVEGRWLNSKKVRVLQNRDVLLVNR